MIKISKRKFKQVEKRLGQYPKKAPLVIARALNRAAMNLKTNVSKETRKVYTVKAADIKKTLRIKRSSRTKLFAAVISEDGAIGLDSFRVLPGQPRHENPPKIVKVRIKKSGGAKKVVDGFVAEVNGRNRVFKRKPESKHRRLAPGKWTELPIERQFGPPVPLMMGSKSIRKVVEREAAAVFKKRLKHEIKRVLEGN